MKTHCRLPVLSVVFLFMGISVAFAGPDLSLTPDGRIPGLPFESLQQQILDLQAQLNGLTGNAAFSSICSQGTYVTGMNSKGELICSDGSVANTKIGDDCPDNFVAGADMQNCVLPSQINLSELDLTGINFGNATINLLGVRTILDNANFQGAKTVLRLYEGSAKNANFTNAASLSLEGRQSDFSSANISESNNVTKIYFSSTTLDGFRAVNSSPFTEFTIENCSAKNSDFSGSAIYALFNPQSRVAYSDFSNSKFIGTVIGVRMTEVNFTGANLANSQSGVVPYKLNLTNANLLGSNLRLDSSHTYSNTICPDGTNSDTNGGTCVGHVISPY